jgi:prophage regulatory protein
LAIDASASGSANKGLLNRDLRGQEVGLNTLANIPSDLSRDRLLGSGQSAEFLGLSVAHFRRLYRTNKVPAPIRIGERKYAWRLGILIDFVAAKSGQAA